MEIICQILEKNFCGLGSWQISTAHYCGRGRMIRLFTTILIMMNYYSITATYLSTYMLPAATTYYCNVYICNIYIMIYTYMYIYVYVYATLSSLALSSQPVCAWAGWHRCLTVCTYTHIVQTIVSHLLSLLLLLLLYILYNIYTTTIHIPNMIFVYIILYHVKRLCYIPALVYITLCYTTCICMPHPTVIYDYGL